MRLSIHLITILIFVSSFLIGKSQTVITSWNLCNFGKSKSDSEIDFIAKTVKHTDILAIQEISDSYYGAQALAKLIDALNRTGSKWNYILSEPTKGNGSERYAFVWKSSKLKLLGKGWLEKSLDKVIDREPFMAKFQLSTGEIVLLATIHAVPKAKEPWKECKHLYKLDELYKAENLLIMGDFNLSESNKAFQSLKDRDILPAFSKLKTSIKMEPKGDEKFANEYDNLFVDRAAIKVKNSGRIDFTNEFKTLKESRQISDHLPVFVEITF